MVPLIAILTRVFALVIWFFAFLLTWKHVRSLLSTFMSYIRSLAQDTQTFHRLLSIFLLGGFLRILTFGAYLRPTYAEAAAFYLDDPNATRTALQMVLRPDLNPHWFKHPSLSYYLNAIVFAPFVLAGYYDYRILHIIARSINFLCSMGTILVTFQLGKEARDESAGLLSALFLAINPLEIHFSFIGIRWEYIRSTFLISIALLYFVRVVNKGKKKDLFLAAIFTGLATTTNYPAGLLVIFIPIVLFWRKIKKDRRSTTATDEVTWQDSVYALGLMILVFLVISPFVILAFNEFWIGFNEVLNSNIGSSATESIDPIATMERFDYSIFPLMPLLVLSFIGICLVLVMHHNQKEKKMGNSILIHIIWISISLVAIAVLFNNPERTWRHLPILPSISVIIGNFCTEILDISGVKIHSNLTRLRKYAGSIIILLFAILSCTVALGQQLSTFHDTQTAVANWASENLELGSTVLGTRYTYVASDLFDFELRKLPIDADDVEKIHPKYILVSSRMYTEAEFVAQVLNFTNLTYIKIKEFIVDPKYMGRYRYSNNHGNFGISWIIAALTTDDLMTGYDILVFELIS